MKYDTINLQVNIVLYRDVTLLRFLLKDQYFEILFPCFHKISNIDELHSSYAINNIVSILVVVVVVLCVNTSNKETKILHSCEYHIITQHDFLCVQTDVCLFAIVYFSRGSQSLSFV